jgi:hypothetical protein
VTAGGRRTWGPRRRGWGETAAYLPPAAPPEGIDLVIEKAKVDDDVIRRNRELRAEERASRSDLEELADGVAELTRPERDHLGRVVVDWRYALVGAAIVAVVAGLGFWVVYGFLTASPATP